MTINDINPIDFATFIRDTKEQMARAYGTQEQSAKLEIACNVLRLFATYAATEVFPPAKGDGGEIQKRRQGYMRQCGF